MKDLVLEVLFTIYGVGAASGLHFEKNKLFIISDNSNYLYEYTLENKELAKHLLINFNNINENVIKKKKLDLESIFKYNNTLYLLGSMSSPNRLQSFQWNLKSNTLRSAFALNSLAQRIHNKLSINDENLNIEGSFLFRNNYYLFNRGNGPENKNGIILINKDLETNIQFMDIPLPKDNNLNPTFTDAIRIGEKVFFLAAAENTTSTYLDGEIAGSYLGMMNLQTLKVEYFQQISTTHKFEGITLYKSNNEQYEFLLCEDTDKEEEETVIYKLSYKK